MALPPMSVPPPRIPDQFMPSPRVSLPQRQSQPQSSQAVTSDNEKVCSNVTLILVTNKSIHLTQWFFRHL